jgi:putative phosphoesterase
MKEFTVIQIALLSDIHANLPALQAVLNYCNQNSEIKQIISLGDLIGIGPNPKEVFDLVLNDARFMNIMGNHEEFLFNPHITQTRKEELEHYKWIKNELGPDRLEIITKFPKITTMNINNNSLFLVHSRRPPANSSELPLLFQGKSLTEFQGDYPKFVSFVIFGHIHKQFLLQESNPVFICPGSVGCAFLPSALATFAILELSSSDWNIKFCQVPYDLKRILNDFDEREVPDRFFIKQQFFMDKEITI